MRTLGITCPSQLPPATQTWGDLAQWKLISKVWNEEEGWQKSVKALEVAGLGCLVWVSNVQQGQGAHYAVAEAMTWVPNTTITETTETIEGEEVVTARALTTIAP